ncbi:hypothetical protein JOB18_035520 [Solea senegalensis]|uniref:Uncharacterized protein n=1 Tax=Solea senegalensis TaxID=28829 RepID=A0AAV6REE7_SOLSE|nr:hypothetical protein JOB18_035520 [Solea senegalensis]
MKEKMDGRGRLYHLLLDLLTVFGATSLVRGMDSKRSDCVALDLLHKVQTGKSNEEGGGGGRALTAITLHLTVEFADECSLSTECIKANSAVACDGIAQKPKTARSFLGSTLKCGWYGDKSASPCNARV